MPRTRSLAWSELKIGVLTIGAIVIAAATIFSVMGTKGFFWQRYTLKTKFGNVAGLKSGSPVRVAGVEVGSVTDVVFNGDAVDVVFEVNKDVRSRITTGSKAVLGSVSLLGLSAVDISAASNGQPIPENGYVPTGATSPALSDVTAQASEGIGELTGLIKDVRAGKGTVGKAMTDDKLYNELQQFVAAAGDVTRSIRSGRGTAGKLINDPALFNQLKSLADRLDLLTRNLNQGEGTLGQMLKDKRLYENINGAVTDVRDLVAAIKKDPKKYLNVRVSIF
jgi:phospholipid/cholesterol/gamma-HCH transport system substrate-binding protein